MNELPKLFWIVCSIIVGCSYSCKDQAQKSTPAATTSTTHTKLSANHGYNFASPSSTLNLSADLAEISGLAYDTVSGMLIGVNDELGNIYHINKYDGRTVNIEKFGKKGDYEGLATNADITYVLKSNGNVYAYNRATTATTKYKTGLTASQDAEGLLLLDDGNLLIACKGNKKTGAKSVKNIYLYNISQEALSEKPIIAIHDSTLTALVDHQQAASKAMKRMLQKRAKEFSPSAIAQEPNTGRYYVLSARGSTIVLCTEQKVEDIIFLNERQQPQPEGICFDTDHNLYIANEGRGLGARIFVYQPIYQAGQ